MGKRKIKKLFETHKQGKKTFTVLSHAILRNEGVVTSRIDKEEDVGVYGVHFPAGSTMIKHQEDLAESTSVPETKKLRDNYTSDRFRGKSFSLFYDKMLFSKKVN